jgi:hypothetical protein
MVTGLGRFEERERIFKHERELKSARRQRDRRESERNERDRWTKILREKRREERLRRIRELEAGGGDPSASTASGGAGGGGARSWSGLWLASFVLAAMAVAASYVAGCVDTPVGCMEAPHIELPSIPRLDPLGTTGTFATGLACAGLAAGACGEAAKQARVRSAACLHACVLLLLLLVLHFAKRYGLALTAASTAPGLGGLRGSSHRDVHSKNTEPRSGVGGAASWIGSG